MKRLLYYDLRVKYYTVLDAISRKALIFDETIEQWIRSGSRTVLLERALALAMETYPCCMSVFGLLQGLLDRSAFGGTYKLEIVFNE